MDKLIKIEKAVKKFASQNNLGKIDYYREVRKMTIKDEFTVKKEIINLLHKFCSGSIDEDGGCYISSIEFENLTEEILKLIKEKVNIFQNI